MLNAFRGNRPDVTPAQVAAVLVAGVPIVSNLLAAFDVVVVNSTQQAALSDTVTWGGVVAGLLIAGDVGLRSARNRADANRDVAALTKASEPHDLLPPIESATPIDQLSDPGEEPLDPEEIEPVVGYSRVDDAVDPGLPPAAFEPDAYEGAEDAPEAEEDLELGGNAEDLAEDEISEDFEPDAYEGAEDAPDPEIEEDLQPVGNAEDLAEDEITEHPAGFR
ncbi:MAG: hypothetical protein M3355_08720 [Actinomycetota bacterium]|nr:hypothetical protein [Actinomycetota bacterium]